MKRRRIIQSGRIQRTQRQGEVGLGSCLIILLVLIVALVVAAYASSWFGWLGFLVGGIIGVPVSFGAIYIVLTVLAFGESFLFGGIPYMPTCSNGKCKSRLLEEGGDYNSERNEFCRAYFRCKCGHLYWRNRKEGRVLEVLPDGTTRPYMIWRSCRGWYPDA
jgi:hypothetical protein